MSWVTNLRHIQGFHCFGQWSLLPSQKEARVSSYAFWAKLVLFLQLDLWWTFPSHTALEGKPVCSCVLPIIRELLAAHCQPQDLHVKAYFASFQSSTKSWIVLDFLWRQRNSTRGANRKFVPGLCFSLCYCPWVKVEKWWELHSTVDCKD